MGDERAIITNKQGKKKIHHPLSSLSIGGEGGIAGLLVFGGALAVAGFMAVASFASNKNKAKGTHRDHQPKPKPQQLSLDENEDYHEATTQDGDAACCWKSNISLNQVSSSELLSAQTLILEEKVDPKLNSEAKSPTCFLHQEIVFSDDSHPQSAVSSNENGVGEECSVSLSNSPSCHAQQVHKDEPQDGFESTEAESKDDDIDEDEDVDLESDDVSVSGEEDSSKASGSTSLDYNEEPVWPAELIQDPEQELKGDYCDSHVCSDCDADGSDYAGNDEAMTVTPEATLNEKANFSLVLNHQPSVPRTWVIPMLLLALMLVLVLLNRHSQESFYALDDGNSVMVS